MQQKSSTKLSDYILKCKIQRYVAGFVHHSQFQYDICHLIIYFTAIRKFFFSQSVVHNIRYLFSQSSNVSMPSQINSRNEIIIFLLVKKIFRSHKSLYICCPKDTNIYMTTDFHLCTSQLGFSTGNYQFIALLATNMMQGCFSLLLC